MTYFVGIDPGLSGAVAFIMESGQVYLFDLPVFRNTKGKREIDVLKLREILEEANHQVVFIEDVWSLPNQGAPGNFTFGFTCGKLRAAVELISGAESIYLVTPQKWKKYMGVTSDKEMTWRKAVELFPKMEPQLTTKRGKKLIDRAEALLIAEYGRRIFIEE